jgi:hypothetical protein
MRAASGCTRGSTISAESSLMFVLLFCGSVLLVAGLCNEALLGDVHRVLDLQYLRDRLRQTPFRGQRILFGRIAIALGAGSLLAGALVGLLSR